MRKDLKNYSIFPMPVLLIATYNEDGTVDVMNAAWGMQLEQDRVILNLTESHKTVENIKRTKGLTVSFATAKHVKEADYFGIVSAHKEPKKFEKSGLHAIKSNYVNAPLIEEFPLTLECEFVEFQRGENGAGLVAKVVNTSVDESIMKDGKVDIDALEAIAFDSYTLGYYKVSGRVGNAFKDGASLK